MSNIRIHSVEFACRPQERALARLLRHVASVAGAWRRSTRDRSLLINLRDRDIHDLGVTRFDLGREMGKPFYRA